MKIEHIAIWTKDLDVMKDFYCRHFGGVAGPRYHNPKKRFTSYFLSFQTGARLELMHSPSDQRNTLESPQIGYAHFAFSVGSKEAVDHLTETLRTLGYIIKSEPRTTGDGYYESCILDPEENLVEITV